MEATIDRVDRSRYLVAPTRPACEIEALLDDFYWLLAVALAGPGAKEHRKARQHAREFAALGLALLEWTLEREPSSEQSGDLHAYFDACVRNAGERRRVDAGERSDDRGSATRQP